MSLTINGSTGISGVDGSATTPAFQGGDTNTGLFYGTDTVSIATGGTTAVTVDASQRAVFVAGTAALPAITTTGDTNTGIFFPAADTIGFTEGGAEVMRIASDGNVLVGKTSTGFSTNGIELRADNELWVTRDGSIPISLNRKTSTGELIRFHYNGTKVGDISTNGTGTTYNSSSDYRLKENIVPMTGALDKIAQLKPVTYTWKADGSNGQGFIAHELQAVVPDCVTGKKDAVNEDGSINPQGIDTSKLVATLTKAIQEQQELIKQLQLDVSALKEANNV